MRWEWQLLQLLAFHPQAPQRLFPRQQVFQ
jgi:hypothetical protein